MCDMDMISLRGTANILQAPANCLPYLSASEEELNRSYFSGQNCAERDDDSQEELCQVAISKSLDSLNTLLDKLPDIVIPEPIYNPLPLQCLAASCLPESVRCEIDTVLQEFSVVLKSPSHILRQQVQRSFEHPAAECCNIEPPMSGEMGEQSAACKKEDGGKAACDKERKDAVVSETSGNVSCADKMERRVQGNEAACCGRVILQHVVVERSSLSLDNVHDLTLGIRVVGGVKCPSCATLHTVITGVSENSPSPLFREGMSVKEWGGKELEGCSYEEVRSFLNSFVCTTSSTVELVLKKCSGNFVTRPKDEGRRANMLGAWQSMRRTKRPDIRLISKRRQSEPSHSPPEEESPEPENCPHSSPLRSTTNPITNHQHSSLPAVTPLAMPPLWNRRATSPQPLSRSRSPSPSPETVPKMERSCESPKAEPETIVSIPRLDSNARELSVRPRSPIATEDGHFSRFANGMIQLSMAHDSETEDLQVTLHKVKGQSNKDISDSSDVFINTYLVPDRRDQGVRAVGVSKGLGANGDTSPTGSIRTSCAEEQLCYMLNKEELEDTAVRVILWDATKSKKTIFRGEVLLSLSDSSVIPLTGQPMWFTVCPLDPNLPPLPKPVHHKQQLSPSSQKRHSSGPLSRLVQKAQAMTSSTAGSSIRQSVTLTDGFPTAKKGSPKSSPKHVRKAKSGHFDGGKILGILEGTDIRNLPATRHTINEAKLAKLSSIITVLRQSVVEDNGGNSAENAAAVDGCGQRKRESTPEFLSMFKEQGKEEREKAKDDHIQLENPPKDSDKKKTKRKSKPPRTMLKAVKEGGVDVHHISDSFDSDDGPSVEGNSTLNQQSLEWLASRKKSDEEDGDNLQKIPNLRESLHGSRPNRVNNYMFESQSAEVKPSLNKIAELKHRQDCESAEVLGSQHQQLHYKLVDTKAQGEREERTNEELHEEGTMMTASKNCSQAVSIPTSHAVSSPDCKCYPVPVEVAVHRINVVDVDRQQEEAKADIIRTRSVDTRPTGAWSKKDGSGKVLVEPLPSSQGSSEAAIGDKFSGILLRAPSSASLRKSRSQSMGDVELLGSDEEVLLVRTPPRNTEPKEAYLDMLTGQRQSLGVGGDSLGHPSLIKDRGELVPPRRILEEEESRSILQDPTSTPDDALADSDMMSSLDRVTKPSSDRHSQPPEVDTPPHSTPTVVLRHAKASRLTKLLQSSQDVLEVTEGSKRSSWMERDPANKKQQGKITKFRSMDNLIDTVELEGKRNSKSSWKQNYVYGQGNFPDDAPKQIMINGGADGNVTGSAKLELEYNDLNPDRPVLLVKLLDILLQSSKNLSSELALKCHVIHSSTRVCILKNKTVVNIKNPLPSAPLGIIQFQTNFSNLTLQITFMSLGKLFVGKKEIGSVNLELNSLQLSRDSTYMEWVPIKKQVTS